ncbi:helix-turn-helix domain-containing protein [Weissella confusa]|uniref:helix-turn-helix domain-containing protein n=1 Tax=Weissella confusa TaxID=1583 RepID=UPI0013E06A76|nr:helix-turn-helix transcriptional regulator [Weissella confusa]MBA5932961.1 helix-turn-helix transcriptional regulator [Weissella confusa]MBJ7697028.1 helix-turn-helix transcriptional regulator [Weissella confusa]MEE0001135.1 helix-turn-helix transcriptional regulator [Weissella confusa]QIE78451.1 helix-turn-helix transcriptional regulator [Weissella confusa]
MATEANEIMSENIKFYLNKNGKTPANLISDLNIKRSTVYNWLNGVSYPRIDKIEAMADYFGVTKADLVERHVDGEKVEHINLDEALRKQGVVMEYQGKELSDKAKRKILDILKIVDDDED